MAQVTVEWGESPYTQRIRARGHQWSADEPREAGGKDEGPTPYELLLSALGACTAITLQMYAGRKGWPLEGLKVELEHSRIHARDCEDCESEEGMVTEIHLRLDLRGPLSEAQRARLLEIAGKCPVKRTLEGEIKIRSALVPVT